MFWSSAESRRATLVSDYLVVWTRRVREGKSPPHPPWTITKNSNRQNSSKQHKQTGDYWSLLHSTFFRGTELFNWEFGLTMQRMTTYSCRKGLVNPSAVPPVPFTVRRELNSFEAISCFMNITFNNCIELGIVPLPLVSNWLLWILHWAKVIFETSNPYPLLFCSHL